MKNKKDQESEAMKALQAFMEMASYGNFGSIFGGSYSGFPNLFEEPEKYPYDRLGDGYELRPIKLTNEEEKGQQVRRR